MANEPDKSTPIIPLNLGIVGSPEVIGPLVELLRQHDCTLVSLNYLNGGPRKPRRTKAMAEVDGITVRGQILAKLREGGEVHRAELRAFMKETEHSPNSVGSVCTQLAQEGLIFSPRRGFWKIKR